MDSFAGIEAFAAVVERGSFTAAAAALQTAKSSVSETVRALARSSSNRRQWR